MPVRVNPALLQILCGVSSKLFQASGPHDLSVQSLGWPQGTSLGWEPMTWPVGQAAAAVSQLRCAGSRVKEVCLSASPSCQARGLWHNLACFQECQKHLPSRVSGKECGHTWSSTTAGKPQCIAAFPWWRGRRSETLTELLSATSGTGGGAVLENLLFPPPSSPSR